MGFPDPLSILYYPREAFIVSSNLFMNLNECYLKEEEEDLREN